MKWANLSKLPDVVISFGAHKLYLENIDCYLFDIVGKVQSSILSSHLGSLDSDTWNQSKLNILTKNPLYSAANLMVF